MDTQYFEKGFCPECLIMAAHFHPTKQWEAIEAWKNRDSNKRDRGEVSDEGGENSNKRPPGKGLTSNTNDGDKMVT